MSFTIGTSNLYATARLWNRSYAELSLARQVTTVLSEFVLQAVGSFFTFSLSLLIRSVIAGLRADRLTGKFHLPNPTTPTFGTLDADQAVSVSFTHSATLSLREYASIQCAVLHTTTDGQRRVRVINIALQVAELAGDVFRFSDMDVVVAHLMRQCKSIFRRECR